MAAETSGKMSSAASSVTASACAVIFDFDGVLVDSERLHCETMGKALRGVLPPPSWSTYCARLMGSDDRDSFSYLLRQGGILPTPERLRSLVETKARLFARAAAEGRIPPLPGAVEFVRACARSLPVALCSGALRSDILPLLRHIGLENTFRVILTAEDVLRSKPDPSSYQLCLERLAAQSPCRALPADRVWAVEDTPDGITSARGAGLRVLALTSQFSANLLEQAGAIRTAPSLQNLEPAILTLPEF